MTAQARECVEHFDAFIFPTMVCVSTTYFIAGANGGAGSFNYEHTSTGFILAQYDGWDLTHPDPDAPEFEPLEIFEGPFNAKSSLFSFSIEDEISEFGFEHHGIVGLKARDSLTQFANYASNSRVTFVPTTTDGSTEPFELNIGYGYDFTLSDPAENAGSGRALAGVETDTYDLTGRTVFKAPKNSVSILTKEMVEETIHSFIGIQDQIPPSFSALKHEGQPLYKLARQGKMIQKPPRQIEIFDICIQQIELPHVDIEVFCSSGTYIRSLAFDIGRKLGCGAHLSKLCRTQSSAFVLKDAISLGALEALDRKTAEQRIVSLSDCLEFMPKMVVDKSIAQKIKYGQTLLKNQMGSSLAEPEQPVRVTDNNNDLLAIIQLNKEGREYKYCCVFSS